VRLPGGALEVTVGDDLARVIMRGPAERVFAGETDL
jgi:diaminopimelate epimerase